MFSRVFGGRAAPDLHPGRERTMPLDAWVLLVAAVGLGLALEIAFYGARLRERRRRP